jgi:hypothetical protein
MTKLIAAVRNFANAPKKESQNKVHIFKMGWCLCLPTANQMGLYIYQKVSVKLEREITFVGRVSSG